MDISRQLKDLSELHRAGALSAQEFERAKDKLLAGYAKSATQNDVVTVQLTKPELKREKFRASAIVMTCFFPMLFAPLLFPQPAGQVIAGVATIGFFYGAFRYIRVRRRIWLEHE